MRSASILLILSSALIPLLAQDANEGPSDEKAQKTYKQALEELRQHRTEFALDSFKKADKQDGGRCSACQLQMIIPGTAAGDFKRQPGFGRRAGVHREE